MKRQKTSYPGVFYREAERIGRKGAERVYYILFKKDGKVVEEKVGRQYADAMTPARAAGIRANRIEGKQASRRELRQAVEAAKKAEADRWTIARLWDRYCEVNPSNKALVHERGKFNRYLRKTIGNKEPADLVALDVDRIRLGLQKQGKQTTAARVLEILRRTINFGVKRALVPPIKFKIEVPRLNNVKTEDLAPKQLQKLMEVLATDPDQTAADVMRLALTTGMRRGEILRLRWEDIDERRGFITIRDPKGGRDQTIPLNSSAAAILHGIPKSEGSPWVFTGRRKSKAGEEPCHLTDCRKGLARIRSAAGLPPDFRPVHGLRHVYASMLASSGEVDLYTLQRLLTHKSPLMTQRYAHLRDDALKKASELAGNLVSEIANSEDKDEAEN